MKHFLQSVKGKVATASVALLSAPVLFAAATPTVPATPLKDDVNFALFDYVFAGVIAVALVFMIARRVKGFIK